MDDPVYGIGALLAFMVVVGLVIHFDISWK